MGPDMDESLPLVAPQATLGAVTVVEATELDIAAAIVLLKARAVHFGNPKEVDAYPLRPDYAWRQAALNFIRQNQEQSAKGLPTLI